MLRALVLLALVLAWPATATMWEEGSIPLEAWEFTDLGTKWEPGEDTGSFYNSPPGTPGGATYSIMPPGTEPHPTFDTHMGAVSELFPNGHLVGDCLDQIAAVSDFENLGEVPDSGTQFDSPPPGFGDIRVGRIAMDGPGGVLAHAFQPGSTGMFSNPSLAGDTHFDVAEIWCEGCPEGFDEPSVVCHEIGHTVGLGHSMDRDALMWPGISRGQVKPFNADDIAGFRALYGYVCGGADYDDDGTVLGNDFAIFSATYGSVAPAARYDACMDCDTDGVIGASDFVCLVEQWGKVE